MTASLVAAPAPLQGTRGRNRADPAGCRRPHRRWRRHESLRPAPGATEGFGWVFNNVTGFITLSCIEPSHHVQRAAAGGLCPLRHHRRAADNGRLAGATRRHGTSGDRCRRHAQRRDRRQLLRQHDVGAGRIAYYCAVPVSGDEQNWSGKSTLTGLTLAATATTASSTAYRVCRYTSSRWNTVTPVVPNEEQLTRLHGVRTARPTRISSSSARAAPAGPCTPAPMTPCCWHTFDQQAWP